MTPVIINEDLFLTECDVIAHQVNCLGKMGSGVAKQIRSNYPSVYESYVSDYYSYGDILFGTCRLVEIQERVNLPVGPKYVANLYGQYTYRNGLNEDLLSNLPSHLKPYMNSDGTSRFTSYDAFMKSLSSLRYNMECYGLTSVAFPYKIGCDRGGGNWDIILKMIELTFRGLNINVEIYKL